MEDLRQSSPLALALLGLLTLAGLCARLPGISARLPHQSEPDSVIVSHAAWLDRPADLEKGTFEAYPANFYPHLLSFALRMLPGHSYARVLPSDAPLEAHLAAAAGPFVRGRLLVALLSLTAIPGTYFLARRFLASGWSLLAAAFVATSLIGSFYAQQARPHAAGMALSLLAVLAILRTPRGGLAAFATAGGLCALAVGCLWNGVFVLPALAVAHVVGAEPGSEKVEILGVCRRRVGVLLALALVAMAIPVFYGFLFEGPWLRPGGESGGLKLGGQTLRWKELTGAGFGLMARDFWSFDPVLVAAAGVGAVLLPLHLLREPRPAPSRLRELVIAATFPAVFFLFWGVMSRVPPRFALPLLPYVAVLAAFGVQSVLPQRVPRPWSFALALAALVLPALAVAHLTLLRSSTDTLTLAARWIAGNTDRERDVVTIPYLTDLPLFEERSALDALPAAFQSPWQRYQARMTPSAALPAYRLHTLYSKAAIADRRIDPEEVREILAAEHATYAVVVLHADSGIGWDSTRDVLLDLGSELVARFVPHRPGAEETLDVGFEQGDRALAKVLSAERPGPVVEIYRVAGQDSPRSRPK